MMKNLAYKKSTKDEASCLFELLLGTKLVGTATLLLTTVGSTRRETSITLTTDHLVTVVLGSQSLKRGLNDTTTKTEDQVKGRFLLDVVITQRTTIFELLTGEDKTLLIRGDTFLILNLLLDIVNGVGTFDLQSDGLASQSLYEDLHSKN